MKIIEGIESKGMEEKRDERDRRKHEKGMGGAGRRTQDKEGRKKRRNVRRKEVSEEGLVVGIKRVYLRVAQRV